VVGRKPIINDVTLHDAISNSMDKVAEIVSSGSEAPANILSQCFPQILQLYHSADITIAEVQGNYESLSDEAKSISVLLEVKCPVMAGLLGANVGDAVLKSERL